MSLAFIAVEIHSHGSVPVFENLVTSIEKKLQNYLWSLLLLALVLNCR